MTYGACLCHCEERSDEAISRAPSSDVRNGVLTTVVSRGDAMADRSRDWLAPAQRDLSHAIDAAKGGHFEWACFSAQQGAEKAVKAVYLSLHGEGSFVVCSQEHIG